MENTSSNNIVSVRFSKVGKLYHFDAAPSLNIEKGDQVVVETARGWQLGEVAQIIGNVPNSNEGVWKKIDRKANEEDFQQRKINEKNESDILELARKEIRLMKLEGVKIAAVEISLDGSRISVLYGYEGENKIDLKNIKQEINKRHRNSQVEFRQIGPRDVAKIYGGMGACGMPTRCCSKFLTDFSSISIRMAKEQGISLTPNEITGMCGRLRCCLIYEYEMYAENRRQLPKRNKRVLTPVGEGKVFDVLPLKMAVIVDIPEVGKREFFNSDVQVIDGQSPVKEFAKELEEIEEDGTFIKESQQHSVETPSQKEKDIKLNNYSTDKKGRRPKWKKRRPSKPQKKNDYE